MHPHTKIVGILNITPDSFSDGGNFSDAGAALARVSQMVGEGADVIDIGAESTRPGATPLTHAEEWARLAPVLSRTADFPVPVSVDTRHAETARKALALGVSWINDVSGFQSPDMQKAVFESRCKLVVMHSLSVPADKSITLPESRDVIKELVDFAHTRVGYMERMGISRSRILFDPGIGFGKTALQSQEILDRIDELKILNLPLYIGHSRKSFLSAGNSNRDDATLAVSRQLVAKGVDYLRVHHVAAHRALINELRGAA